MIEMIIDRWCYGLTKQKYWMCTKSDGHIINNMWFDNYEFFDSTLRLYYMNSMIAKINYENIVADPNCIIKVIQ